MEGRQSDDGGLGKTGLRRRKIFGLKGVKVIGVGASRRDRKLKIFNFLEGSDDELS